MFTRRSLFAFVDVFGTIDSFVAGSTRTSVRTVDRTCIAYGIGMTRVGRARVVKVAQKTGLSVCALAVETADPVDASGAVETGGPGAIVNVHRTVLSSPAVYANAIVRSQRIGTSRTVVTDTGPHGTLVYVHLTRISGPLSWARARVTVHTVHARTTVQAGVRYAIVDIFLAVLATETRLALALVIEIVDLHAPAAVHTRRRVARDVYHLAVFACVTWFANTRIRSMCVDALSMHAGFGC